MNSDGPDPIARSRSLIWAFAVHTCSEGIFSLGGLKSLRNFIRLYNYLTDRKHGDDVLGISSDATFIKAGVPQGSILGTLMFIDDLVAFRMRPT